MDGAAKFILTFSTNLSARDTYTIPRANRNLTSNEVMLLMDRMIENGNIATTKGLPTVSESAELIEYNYTELI